MADNIEKTFGILFIFHHAKALFHQMFTMLFNKEKDRFLFPFIS